MYPTADLATWTRDGRTFWWDRDQLPEADAEVYPLQAVIFDLDALADADGEPRTGVVDLAMSLFGAGIWVAVVSAGTRDWVQPRVRELLGDGMAETIVCADDLTGPAGDTELYRLVLWELGIVAGEALVIAGSERGGRAASAAGLPVVTADDSVAYDGLLASGCRRLQAQLVVDRFNCRAAS